MLTRPARVGVALLCAIMAASVLGAGAAAAPRARTSVIGGRLASLQDWGFTVAVLTPHTLCTGSVLAPTKVITAAHCVGDPSTMAIRANSTSAFLGGEAIGVESAALAPGYAHGFQADVAVLTLKAPTSAPPIPLATPAEDASYTQPGAPLQVAGFGNRNPRSNRKPRFGSLIAANVSARRCIVPSWAICDAGRRAGVVRVRFRHHRHRRQIKRTICQGDSGGPLVARTPEGPRLIGIAEASSGPRKPNPFYFVHCGLKGYPSIHTRAASYADFIAGSVG